MSIAPFKLLWLITNTSDANQPGVTPPFQIGISVPKRSFAKAVQRNKLKRRIRESFRKNKHELYEVLKKKSLTVEVVIVYTAKEEQPYSEIEKKMIVSLQKLIAALQ